MPPQDTVTVTATARIKTEDGVGGGTMTGERTEERTFRFPLETYGDLLNAARADPIDVLNRHVDADVYSHGSGDGWAIDVTDSVTVCEGWGMDVRVNMSAARAYSLAREAAQSPVELYTRLHKLTQTDRVASAASEALLHYVHGNTDALDRDEMDGWGMPASYYNFD